MAATPVVQTVDSDFRNVLARFGATSVIDCFNCGNCTAVCALSEGNTPFPRKLIRYAQLGLKEKLVQSPEPWLCYSCGECSATCPRDARPGETMAALRRMRPADHGTSVQVGSALGERSIPLQSAYCAAKHAVIEVEVVGIELDRELSAVRRINRLVPASADSQIQALGHNVYYARVANTAQDFRRSIR